jgi:flagellar hook-associated protein 3 FlgL
MRVTNRMMIENSIRSMQDNLERLTDLRTKASSNKAFQFASDNPSAAIASLNLRSGLQANQAYLDTAQSTKDWMEATEYAFSQMEDLATRALNLAMSGLNDTLDETNLQAAATEIDSILQQAIEVGNTQHLGKYIFSGFQIDTEPFELVAGTPDTVIYNGGPYSGGIQRNVSPGQSMTVNIDGESTFLPLFNALIRARDGLLSKGIDGGTELQAAVADLQNALDTVSQVRSSNGARQRQIQAVIDQCTQLDLSLKSMLSQKENANLVEVITLLQQQEITYEAVLEVSRRTLNTMNLFDLIQ